MTDAAVATSDLTKDVISSFWRKPQRVLESLNLKVSQGETYGLLGPNGAGKTTTIKLLLGLMRPTKGDAQVLGKPAGHNESLSRIGFLPENPYFYSHLTGREFLDFVGQLFGMQTRERLDRAKELLETVGLCPFADIAMRKYSKGMLQRLGIAQSLLNDPSLLIWDEPMSGLDPIGRRDIRQLLQKLKESGKTIFFNSHLLADVNEICDRVGILNKGRLVAEAPISDISKTGNYSDLEEYFLTMVLESEEKVESAKTT